MEKMIGVINDNLRSVINGIKTHRVEAEKNLAVVVSEIDDKVVVAGQYKQRVEEARAVIASLENEISELENDLNDLNNKFGAKDFKEILAAGNKEISTKIIEKRSLISNQSTIIAELTEQAHQLKDELLKLKDKKISTEQLLNKSVMLETYYDVRISDIIKFSEENPDSLGDYIDENAHMTMNVEQLEVSDIDIDEVVDGSVFEEIDSISTASVAEEEVNEAIEDIKEGNDDDESSGYIDLSITQQLDNVILAASSIIAKEQETKKKEKNKEPKVFKEINNLDELEAAVKEKRGEDDEESSIEQENLEGLLFDLQEEEEIPERGNHYPVFEDEDDFKVELRLVEDDGPSVNLDEEVVPVVDEELADVSEERFNFIDEDDNREYTLDDFLGPNTKEDEEVEDVTVVDDLLMDTVDPDILLGDIEDEEENEEALNEKEKPIVINTALDVNQMKNKLFDSSTKDFYALLEECELNYDRFSEDDLILLESFFNKDNTLQFIQVLKKHNLGVDCVYENVNILMNVTPQNLDKILSLLKVTGASSSAIKYIFGKLDCVNINDLERAINVNSNRQLIEVLYEAVPYKGEKDLVKALGLDQSSEMLFRNNTTTEEFEMMNLFADVVMTNYRELDKLNIDNLVECLVKHPHRFTYNPDRFMAILDKYDTEDLVRCINKNSAVLDRL